MADRKADRRGRMNRLRLLAAVILAILIALISQAGFRHLAPLAVLEGALTDRMTAVVRLPQSVQYNRLSVITINEATMARLPYRSPIDRGFLADVLLAIRDAGVRSVGFDILFDQPTEPEKDLLFAETIRDYPVPVVLAWADGRAGLTDKQQAWLQQFLTVSNAVPGVVELLLDRDGVVRKYRPSDPVSGFASLPAALTGITGETTETVHWLAGTADGKDAFQVLPAHSVVLMAKRPAILKRWLEGRVVLIGADLPQQDRHKSRLSADPTEPGTTPGVLIHAHVVAQLLDGRSVKELSIVTATLVSIILALLGGLAAISGRPLWQQIPAGVVIGVLWVGCEFWLMSSHQIHMPVAPALTAYVLTYALVAGYDAFRQRQEKAFIRDAFGHYVAPTLVDELSRDPALLKLGGERRTLSFIFTDIAGFTTMSEKLTAPVLTRLLNSYLDGMSEIVLQHGGTLDKFIGDAVVAIFGAPLDQEDHADRALACAMALDAFAEDFRAQHAEEGLGVTRIGVHHGEATVGNFGGDQRFDYTAMGDAMNTAARLEGANKAFGTRIAVSGDLLRAARAPDTDHGMCRIGNVVLKGRKAALEVFSPVTGATEELQWRYDEAFSMMDTDPTAAHGLFMQLQQDWQGNAVVRFHLDRLSAGDGGSTFELKEK